MGLRGVTIRGWCRGWCVSYMCLAVSAAKILLPQPQGFHVRTLDAKYTLGYVRQLGPLFSQKGKAGRARKVERNVERGRGRGMGRGRRGTKRAP